MDFKDAYWEKERHFRNGREETMCFSRNILLITKIAELTDRKDN